MMKRRKYLRWKNLTRCNVEWHEYWDGEASAGRVGYSHEHHSYGYAVFGEGPWIRGYPTVEAAKEACERGVALRRLQG